MSIPVDASTSCLLLKHHPLAQHTSWQVGGCAQFCFQPTSVSELQAALKQIPPGKEAFFLGLGSNTLIRDAGVKGYVVLTRGLDQLLQVDDLMYAQAGVSCASLARFAARQGLGGLEFLAGIPGTVGGALAMNAGANGSETWDFVESVEMIDHAAEIHKRVPGEFDVRYRKAEGREKEWFVGAYFKCQKTSKEQSLSLIKAYLDRRQKTQPINLPNCGCVFVNPEGQHAGSLIDQAGLKGMRIGGAMVSDLHANFIVNQGNASSEDIERLIQHIRDSVFGKFGIRLQTEVKIIGQEGEIKDE